MARFLTKSLFSLALECPTKLYYAKKDSEYANNKLEDPFFEALAEGGFQVGELAKLYHPGGILVEELDYTKALIKTNELLKRENVVIYEAAVKYQNLFIRIDILKKKHNKLELIEVKAKSTDFRDHFGFLNAKGEYLQSKWQSYVYDVAFQKYIIQNAFPNWKVCAYLMLADKNSRTTVDGLNQKFRIKKIIENSKERTKVDVIGDINPASLGDEILININVDTIVDMIFDSTDSKQMHEKSFEERIIEYADHYERDDKIITPIGKQCKECEFKCIEEDWDRGLKSGFKECWQSQLNWSDADFEKPSIFALWNFRNTEKMLNQSKYFLTDLERDDIGDDRSPTVGLSTKDRQWLQVKKVKENNSKEYLNKEGLNAETDNWKYPLHFIDFETASLAIPFNEGMRPYEGICFQFSHHKVDNNNGMIEHAGQYLDMDTGKFPSFDFLRELKEQLKNDNGTIFRYADHENTYLNIIYIQLKNASDREVPDRNELLEFIQSITHSTKGQTEQWSGIRDMVDMRQLVMKYYYNPFTNGSNSLKALLFSVLKASDYLQNKYSKPIYGNTENIKSLNFTNRTWVMKDPDGRLIDPYKLLPPLFKDVDERTRALFMTGENLIEGGAAMIAYAKMQFTEMTQQERDHVIQGLYRYCELDTLAMVMLWEHWNHLLSRNY